MIRISHQAGPLLIDRIDMFKRHGDGCYLTVFLGGQYVSPVPGSIDVPLSRDQALRLSDELADMAERLGPGVLERRGGAYSYRLRR